MLCFVLTNYLSNIEFIGITSIAALFSASLIGGVVYAVFDESSNRFGPGALTHNGSAFKWNNRFKKIA